MIRFRQILFGCSGPHALLAAATLGVAALSACGSNVATVPVSAVRSPVPPPQFRTSTPPAPRPDITAAAAKGAMVAIDNFIFAPVTVTIPVGTTVTWMNRDTVPHIVMASDKSFGSPALDSGAQFANTFTAAGTFSYFCAIHPFMTAKVIVQ